MAVSNPTTIFPSVKIIIAVWWPGAAQLGRRRHSRWGRMTEEENAGRREKEDQCRIRIPTATVEISEIFTSAVPPKQRGLTGSVQQRPLSVHAADLRGQDT